MRDRLRDTKEITKDEKNTVAVYPRETPICGVAGQTTPNGYYEIERMLKVLFSKGGEISPGSAPLTADPWLGGRFIARSEALEAARHFPGRE